jgi:hypothetical protein
LCSVDPKLLKLTPHDDYIYKTFREEFPDFRVDRVDEDALKSSEAKQVLCLKIWWFGVWNLVGKSLYLLQKVQIGSGVHLGSYSVGTGGSFSRGKVARAWSRLVTPIYVVLMLTRQALYIYCNTEVCVCNHCCHGKATTITYSKCVIVTLFIQDARHMCHMIFSSVASLVLPYFSTFINGTIFRKKVVEHKMCV